MEVKRVLKLLNWVGSVGNVYPLAGRSEGRSGKAKANTTGAAATTLPRHRARREFDAASLKFDASASGGEFFGAGNGVVAF
jgi:hypothetical protein